eukprot:4980629-Pyramimonas_sp.AAC.2
MIKLQLQHTTLPTNRDEPRNPLPKLKALREEVVVDTLMYIYSHLIHGGSGATGPADPLTR